MRIITSIHREAVMRASLVFTFAVFIGVARAFGGDYVDVDGPPQSAQPAETPPVQPQSPMYTDWPCHFGPITKRIRLEDVRAIIMESPSRRAAWHTILAREDDPETEEITFELAASDDGLGDGLVCPEESP